MEFMQGQVFNLKNFTQHIKNTQIKKGSAQKHAEDVLLFNQAKEEINLLKSTLDEMSDASAAESIIYRLKAAELDFNRYLSDKKSQLLKN